MPITSARDFIEKGPAVVAIQFDGTEDIADEIVSLISPPLRGEVIPRGHFNHDYDNCYVSVQSFYAIKYLGPGDWFVLRQDGEAKIMNNIDFRRDHIALSAM